jgi:ribosomal protein L37AE/L43A
MSDMEYEIEPLVTVASYNSLWEAQLAKARLEAAGIEAVIADENFMRLYWAVSSSLGGAKIQVRESAVGPAAELLERTQPIPEIYLVTEEDAARPRCPACKSDRVWSRFGFLPLPGRRWACHHCGAAWKDDEIAGAQEVLVAEAIPDPPNLVTVARFTTPWEAHLAKIRLASEGIDACVMEERLPPVSFLSSDPLALNRLEVYEDDAEQALAILEVEALADWEEEEEEKPASE